MRLAISSLCCVLTLLVMGLAASPALAQTPAERFAAANEKLQALTARAQEIRAAYAAADPQQQASLAEEFNALIAQLDALTPELTEAAIAAYAAAPNEDAEVTTAIFMVTENAVSRDQFETAYEAAQLMIEHDHPQAPRFALAGIAAFAMGEFDSAAAHFEAAQEANGMTPRAANFAGSVESYREYAREEASLRAAEAEADDLPRVLMQTSEGDMVIELFENEAPNTVANFISLVEDGYYDGLSFHRVLPNFMAQGGCPTGTGTGGPGYAIACELEGTYRRHFRGTLSMAHAGRDTGGSQFFLTFLPTPHLNGRHTAFGRVVEGMDVLAKLERIDPQRPQPGIEPSRIIEASVIRKRDHAYEPETLPARR